MGNSKHKGLLYNKEVKERFLSDRNTKNTLRNLFLNSYEFEEGLGKDLFDFSLAEIESLLDSMDLKSEGSADSAGSNISTYIKWAQKEAPRERTENPFDLMPRG
jgi:hypothetical protein